MTKGHQTEIRCSTLVKPFEKGNVPKLILRRISGSTLYKQVQSDENGNELPVLNGDHLNDRHEEPKAVAATKDTAVQLQELNLSNINSVYLKDNTYRNTEQLGRPSSMGSMLPSTGKKIQEPATETQQKMQQVSPQHSSSMEHQSNEISEAPQYSRSIEHQSNGISEAPQHSSSIEHQSNQISETRQKMQQAAPQNTLNIEQESNGISEIQRKTQQVAPPLRSRSIEYQLNRISEIQQKMQQAAPQPSRSIEHQSNGVFETPKELVAFRDGVVNRQTVRSRRSMTFKQRQPSPSPQVVTEPKKTLVSNSGKVNSKNHVPSQVTAACSMAFRPYTKPAGVFHYTTPSGTFRHTTPSNVVRRETPSGIFRHAAPSDVSKHAAPSDVSKYATPLDGPPSPEVCETIAERVKRYRSRSARKSVPLPCSSSDEMSGIEYLIDVPANVSSTQATKRTKKSKKRRNTDSLSVPVPEEISTQGASQNERVSKKIKRRRKKSKDPHQGKAGVKHAYKKRTTKKKAALISRIPDFSISTAYIRSIVQSADAMLKGVTVSLQGQKGATDSPRTPSCSDYGRVTDVDESEVLTQLQHLPHAESTSNNVNPVSSVQTVVLKPRESVPADLPPSVATSSKVNPDLSMNTVALKPRESVWEDQPLSEATSSDLNSVLSINTVALTARESVSEDLTPSAATSSNVNPVLPINTVALKPRKSVWGDQQLSEATSSDLNSVLSINTVALNARESVSEDLTPSAATSCNVNPVLEINTVALKPRKSVWGDQPLSEAISSDLNPVLSKNTVALYASESVSGDLTPSEATSSNVNDVLSMRTVTLNPRESVLGDLALSKGTKRTKKSKKRLNTDSFLVQPPKTVSTQGESQKEKVSKKNKRPYRKKSKDPHQGKAGIKPAYKKRTPKKKAALISRIPDFSISTAYIRSIVQSADAMLKGVEVSLQGQKAAMDSPRTPFCSDAVTDIDENEVLTQLQHPPLADVNPVSSNVSSNVNPVSSVHTVVLKPSVLGDLPPSETTSSDFSPFLSINTVALNAKESVSGNLSPSEAKSSNLNSVLSVNTVALKPIESVWGDLQSSVVTFSSVNPILSIYNVALNPVLGDPALSEATSSNVNNVLSMHTVALKPREPVCGNAPPSEATFSNINPILPIHAASAKPREPVLAPPPLETSSNVNHLPISLHSAVFKPRETVLGEIALSEATKFDVNPAPSTHSVALNPREPVFGDLPPPEETSSATHPVIESSRQQHTGLSELASTNTSVVTTNPIPSMHVATDLKQPQPSPNANSIQDPSWTSMVDLNPTCLTKLRHMTPEGAVYLKTVIESVVTNVPGALTTSSSAESDAQDPVVPESSTNVAHLPEMIDQPRSAIELWTQQSMCAVTSPQPLSPAGNSQPQSPQSKQQLQKQATQDQIIPPNLQPHSTNLKPHSSDLQQHSLKMQSHSSHLKNSSDLQPHSPYMKPHSTNMQPHSTNMQPATFNQHSSNLQHHSTSLQPHLPSLQSPSLQPESPNFQPHLLALQPLSPNLQPHSFNLQPRSSTTFQPEPQTVQSGPPSLQPQPPSPQPAQPTIFQPEPPTLIPQTSLSQPRSPSMQLLRPPILQPQAPTLQSQAPTLQPQPHPWQPQPPPWQPQPPSWQPQPRPVQPLAPPPLNSYATPLATAVQNNSNLLNPISLLNAGDSANFYVMGGNLSHASIARYSDQRYDFVVENYLISENDDGPEVKDDSRQSEQTTQNPAMEQSSRINNPNMDNYNFVGYRPTSVVVPVVQPKRLANNMSQPRQQSTTDHSRRNEENLGNQHFLNVDYVLNRNFENVTPMHNANSSHPQRNNQQIYFTVNVNRETSAVDSSSVSGTEMSSSPTSSATSDVTSTDDSVSSHSAVTDTALNESNVMTEPNTGQKINEPSNSMDTNDIDGANNHDSDTQLNQNFYQNHEANQENYVQSQRVQRKSHQQQRASEPYRGNHRSQRMSSDYVNERSLQNDSNRFGRKSDVRYQREQTLHQNGQNIHPYHPVNNASLISNTYDQYIHQQNTNRYNSNYLQNYTQDQVNRSQLVPNTTGPTFNGANHSQYQWQTAPNYWQYSNTGLQYNQFVPQRLNCPLPNDTFQWNNMHQFFSRMNAVQNTAFNQPQSSTFDALYNRYNGPQYLCPYNQPQFQQYPVTSLTYPTCAPPHNGSNPYIF